MRKKLSQNMNTHDEGVCDLSYTSRQLERRYRNMFDVHLLKELAERILGKAYAVSCVLTDPKHATQLNARYRQKDYTPNVLSFPLTDTTGEIYICPSVAENEASQYAHSPQEHMYYLFIHGCLHLQGLPHGKRMDTLEASYLAYAMKKLRIVSTFRSPQ